MTLHQLTLPSLPITAQPTYIKAALSAGKHVLSEKPIAKDVASARELLAWYEQNIDKSKATWGVAENFRFFESYQWGAAKVAELGKVVSFSSKVHAYIKEDNKYYAPVGITEYRVVCERGTVTTGFGSVPMSPAYVSVKRADSDEEERKEFPEAGFGVHLEVAAWGEKLEKGGFDERQAPKEALKDLEILEAMLKSGEQGGVPVSIHSS
ncbi:Oxidoreductase [Macrophomina phaseolina MS6]|uniref:Oxidoreductase n=1 Tax=Macrophomina phaseolina (strain MS6) TaxID=1126212 RepID=K2S1Z5_MACPH|nr:Oxidoreductase [Macrophomina phaseolina MS6]